MGLVFALDTYLGEVGLIGRQRVDPLDCRDVVAWNVYSR